MKWILFIILFPVIALAEDCSFYTDDCEYYLCVAREKVCDEYSYPVNFGHRYCLKFSSKTERFTDYGKAWVKETRRCLIHEMSQFEDTLTCSELETRAFKSHVPCYVQSGFCSLPLHDKKIILRTILPTLRNIQVLSSGIQTLRQCY